MASPCHWRCKYRNGKCHLGTTRLWCLMYHIDTNWLGAILAPYGVWCCMCPNGTTWITYKSILTWRICNQGPPRQKTYQLISPNHPGRGHVSLQVYHVYICFTFLSLYSVCKRSMVNARWGKIDQNILEEFLKHYMKFNFPSQLDATELFGCHFQVTFFS